MPPLLHWAVMHKKDKEKDKSLFNDMFLANRRIVWKPLSLGLVGIGGGKSIVCQDHPRIGQAKAMLRLGSVSFGNYNPRDNKQLISEEDFIETAEVRDGDLLMVRKNTRELVGVAAYVFNTPKGLMLPDLIFRIIPNEELNPIYLWTLFNHPAFRGNLTSLATGAAASMVNISKEKLRNLMIPFPEIVLQDAFANRLQDINKLRFIDTLFVKNAVLGDDFGPRKA